jgi:hypothetical protein
MSFDLTTLPDGSVRSRVEPRPVRDGLNFAVKARIAVASAVAADAVLFSFKPPTTPGKKIYIQTLRGTQSFNGTAAAADLGLYWDRYQLTGATDFSGGASLVTKIVSLDDPLKTSVMTGGLIQWKVTALTANNAVLDGRPFDDRGISGSASGTMEEFYVPLGPNGLYLPPGYGLALCVAIVAIAGWTIAPTVHWVEV